MNTNNEIYELDTARAKTPAERLRIVADLLDAQARGETVFTADMKAGHTFRYVTKDDIMDFAVHDDVRLVTKRRPVLTIPALELFEGPMTEEPERGTTYYAATIPGVAPDCGFWVGPWRNDMVDKSRLAAGLCFRTPEAAARIGQHIRAALSKFAGASHE